MKAYAYKKFSYIETFRESSPFEPTKYVEKICRAGWRPYSTVEGRGERRGSAGETIPIYYLVVEATKEIEVDELEPEPDTLG